MKVNIEITDEQALEVGNLFLKSSISRMYNYTFEKITRHKYDRQEGTDAEESISIYFNAEVKEDIYKTSGWQDEKVMVNIVIYDRYHDYTYFTASRKTEEDKTWKTFYVSNHIEVVLYLNENNLIN